MTEEKRATKRKRISWSPDQESLLLSLWQENILELRKCRRNSHVYAEIASELKSHTAQEVHMKINNFTQRYRSEKKLTGPSGGSPSNWKYFERVHIILGSFKANNTELMEESFIFDIDDYRYTSISSSLAGTQLSPPRSPSPSSSQMSTSPLTPLFLNPEVCLSASPASAVPSSSRARPERKKVNTISLQKEALNIARENHEMMREQIAFSQGVMKEQLEMMKQSVENSIDFANKSVEISTMQVELQKNFMALMKEMLNK